MREENTMKALAIFLFGAISFFSFNLSSVDYTTKLENNKVTAIPTPVDGVCFEENYQPKSEATVASMSPRQLIDELIRNMHSTSRTNEESANYQISIEKRIRQAGDKALPILTEYMNNSYLKQSDFYCDNSRFSTVQRMAHDIDRFEFRLRGTDQGKLTIEAYERALERVEKPGFTKKDVSYYRTMFLSDLKGVSHIDQNIQDTFWVHYRIEISESELLEFSNFLIELDPTYPSWSDTDFIKDHSRINQAGNPRQVYVFKKPDRYYKAYLDFQKTKN